MAVETRTSEEKGVVKSGISVMAGLLLTTVTFLVITARMDNSIVDAFVSARPHYSFLKFKAMICFLFVAWNCFACSILYFQFDRIKSRSENITAVMTFANFIRLVTAASILMSTAVISFLMRSSFLFS